MAASDARPVPRKNVAFRVTFPIFDATGGLVAGATSLDSEVSLDGGTFADCTNEATQIATSSGMYYLDLTAAEMNADTVAVIVKSSGNKTTPIVLYPEESGDIRVDTVMISGDSTAADNLEAILDGTGGVVLKLAQLLIAATGNNSAIDVTGAGTGHGIKATGGASAGVGLIVTGGAGAPGLSANGGTGDTAGIESTGDGDGEGLWLIGGDTDGYALRLSGAAIATAPSSGAAVELENISGTGDLILGNGDPIGGGGGGDVNVTQLFSSATAAENAKKFFNNETYNASGGTIGAVSTVVGEVSANLVKINSGTTAVSRLVYLTQGIITGVAVSGTLSTTEMTCSIAETTNNHFGPPQVIKWLTGNLAGQARAITGFVGGSPSKFQYSATTEAPAAGDIFMVV